MPWPMRLHSTGLPRLTENHVLIFSRLEPTDLHNNPNELDGTHFFFFLIRRFLPLPPLKLRCPIASFWLVSEQF